ncbi:MAG: OB-fold domain-containing protein, partial [Actinomycetota bacterium]|nr:OB-fold domain-containing protein [Actinomycetota bacterium]
PGAGTLYTYTITTRPVSPHFASEGPMVLAVVQWDEGPKFSTELINIAHEDIRIGMRVRPVFCDYPDDDITMLRYEPEN